MKYILPFLLLGHLAYSQGNLRYEQNQTLTYDEIIEAYSELDEEYTNAILIEYGPTDCGRNLHVFYLSSSPIIDQRDLGRLKNENAVILVNNGIHPGESCGIDASIEFSRQKLKNGVEPGVLLAIIPVYNIGGALNRGDFSRANQQGPEEHGFRGNARNLDLNRDFIKADALNTLSFYAIFQFLKPHIFVDTHTSNGADYQYTMTLISTHKDKLNSKLESLLTEEIEPYLYRNMAASGWEMTPYVNVFGGTPDKGFASFLETPRYASGYTTLFNTIGFITEAHMLKPYPDRVKSTLQFLNHITAYTSQNSDKVKMARQVAKQLDETQTSFAINWELDSSSVEQRQFLGYDYSYTPSGIGDYERLQYHSSKPVTYDIPYYADYRVTEEATVPRYYVVPQAWREVLLRLQYNGVETKILPRDTVISGMEYRITSADFLSRPYEGHFFIKDLEVSKARAERQFFAGDVLIPMDQGNQRFITAVLEPMAADSYLRWNFFDAIFQQKEHFSAYVFEDTAEKLLKENPQLREELQQWLKANPEQAKNRYAVLGFIYKNSAYYEKEHMRYPVMRVE